MNLSGQIAGAVIAILIASSNCSAATSRAPDSGDQLGPLATFAAAEVMAGALAYAGAVAPITTAAVTGTLFMGAMINDYSPSLGWWASLIVVEGALAFYGSEFSKDKYSTKQLFIGNFVGLNIIGMSAAGVIATMGDRGSATKNNFQFKPRLNSIGFEYFF